MQARDGIAGTPAMATAVPGKAHQRWREARAGKRAEGVGTPGRKRGRRAQLGRRLERQMARAAEEDVRAEVALAAAAEVAASSAQAWAQEARARAEGVVLREELRREEQEKEEQEDEQENERSRIGTGRVVGHACGVDGVLASDLCLEPGASNSEREPIGTSGEEKEEEKESEEQEVAEEQERGVVRGVQLVVKDEERG